MEAYNQEELDQMTSEMMRYMLFKNYKDPNVPVRREELTEQVSKVYKNRRGFPSAVIENAKSKFLSIFGLELREIIRVRPNKSNVKSQDGEINASKCYVIRSRLTIELKREYVDNPEDLALKGLVSVIIAIIKLEGGRVEQKDLWLRLGQLGLSESELQHPKFGNVSDSFFTIVKQRYIQAVTETNPEGISVTNYELAENALDEFGAEEIDSFVSKVMENEADVS